MTRPTPSDEPLPATDGGAAWELVELRDGKPACKRHGAMNKVSPSPPEGGGFWRCLQERCRAGCRERPAL